MIVEKIDRQIGKLIEKETRRQEETLNLIASENYPSKAVREASVRFLLLNILKAGLIKGIMPDRNLLIN